MLVNIIVSRNRVSGEIRTGIRLRLENPPPGVYYRVINEPVDLSPSSNDFYITRDTTTKWFLKALIEPAYSLKLRGVNPRLFPEPIHTTDTLGTGD
ncbi:hypothetical protein [Vulcanisaeta distributa]|uniref:hypothetical protein n=1 Tax=Vulcanisaeta distributa TaxID=164451 RepID=UPI000ACA0534|nr:hypothetical protein [Vulcanisaeta distributa]